MSERNVLCGRDPLMIRGNAPKVRRQFVMTARAQAIYVNQNQGGRVELLCLCLRRGGDATLMREIYGAQSLLPAFPIILPASGELTPQEGDEFTLITVEYDDGSVQQFSEQRYRVGGDERAAPTTSKPASKGATTTKKGKKNTPMPPSASPSTTTSSGNGTGSTADKSSRLRQFLKAAKGSDWESMEPRNRVMALIESEFPSYAEASRKLKTNVTNIHRIKRADRALKPKHTIVKQLSKYFGDYALLCKELFPAEQTA